MSGNVNMDQAELDALRQVVNMALNEELAYGPDETTEATVPAYAAADAAITPREYGVLAGVDAAMMVFDALAPDAVVVLEQLEDGDALVAGKPAMIVQGRVRTLLTGERTVLNLISHLSGIATATMAWVAAVSGTGCRIRDTRKTLPGLRLLEKYAVRCGGGVNHRFGLGDAVLIKDNHIAAAGSVTAAIQAVQRYAPDLSCEVEVDDLDQLDEAIAAGAELVLLDNFSFPECAEAVQRVRDAGAPTLLEASGGLSLDMARNYAETGVDFLAVGSLTHSSEALDLGLDMR